MVIHGNKLRWLFWLRWRTFTRGFRGDIGRIVGTIISFIAFFLLGATLAVGTFFAYRFLPQPINSEVLFIVLTGLYILWLVLPLLEYTTNEGLDISKLALFPLTRAELMASLIFSTLLDIPTIGLVFMLGAVVIGWSTSFPVAVIALLSVIIFYVQMIAASQLLLALLQKILQSRRFRDISIIFVVLLSSTGYLCQFAIRGLATKDTAELLQNGTLSQYLQWAPSGMAARAIEQATKGNWLLSGGWLIALAALSLLFLFCWQLIVERGLTAADSAGTVKKVQRHGTANRTGSANGFARFIPPQVQAICGKEFKYYWRDPQLKAAFISSTMSIFFLVIYFGFNLFSNSSRGPSTTQFLGPWTTVAAPAFVLLSLYGLSCNVLGMERQSLTTLFLFPVDPKYILYGKNIALFSIGLVEMLVITLVVASLTQAWNFILPALVVGCAGVSITIGLGNFTSIFLPQKMRQARRGFQTNSNPTSAGCLRSVYMMLAFGVLLILLIPIAAAIILPVVFGVQWVWLISLPLALIYGPGIYYAITYYSAPYMLKRTPDIVALITKE